MNLNVGKIGSIISSGVRAAKPYVTNVGAAIKSLPADMVTLSAGAKKVIKAPRSVLKALWKVFRPVLKWTIAAGILAYRAGKGIVTAAGKVLKTLAHVIKK